jgi:hypothetical protein
MSGMLSFFGAETTDATLTPGDVGTYTTGDWVPASGASIPIRIIVPQPVTENDLQMLQDGEHVRDYRVTWSETRAFVREGNEDSDTITYDGKNYKVVQVNDRNVLGGFYRIVMREID